ncbi:LAMI_0H03884g1_1 [Lachancea mirantina]|uniref:Ubiquitin-activating enzyme E1-like n=1 Tax=Lachancea mirantina TaxID=1230905 RepID=A0A1G4KEL2_9SACH|nr:LAMI_0H03884g1_1 [Lachancea mirantina]
MIQFEKTASIEVLGAENYAKLRHTKVLLVGAGGIGCELLKNLVLMGFGEVHVVDLDTIDLSNLNRQFLFRQRDIRQPKATTAVKAVQHISNSTLIAYQCNIQDTEKFPLSWFSQFALFFNALDNLEARRYVNQIAQLLHKPLIESGTAGFDGYIQPIIPGETECFDCTTKETPKTFPVCTIRSTPSQPVHCIVWAKNFLFPQLFSTSTTASANEDLGTDDPLEIERIRQETNELRELQEYIKSGDESRIPTIIEKLYTHDIEKLLAIENLWRTRQKPVPLGRFDLTDAVNPDFNAVWSLQEQLDCLANATKKLMKRQATEDQIDFDKDDVDSLEFVAAAANIRAHVFHLPIKSIFDIKQIAGNIIPAIATTNAIIAGLSSLASLRVLNLMKGFPVKSPKELNMAFTARASNIPTHRYLSNPVLASPNSRCPVCSVPRGVIKISGKALSSTKLQDLIEAIRQKYHYPGEVSVVDKSTQRLLADIDFDDLLEKSLLDLKIRSGVLLMIADERDDVVEIRAGSEFYIQEDSKNCASHPFLLPEMKVKMVKSEVEPPQESLENGLDETTTNVAQSSDVLIIDEDESGSKRKLEESELPPNKKAKHTEELVLLD